MALSPYQTRDWDWIGI